MFDDDPAPAAPAVPQTPGERLRARRAAGLVGCEDEF
jgi:hypothetical protein